MQCLLCNVLVAVHRWQMWAVHSPMKDLAKQYAAIEPEMAMHFPFELDTFQKEVLDSGPVSVP